MIIKVPPNDPFESISNKKHYICWLGSPEKPENNQSINFCKSEAELYPAKLFISLKIGSKVDFCKSRKLIRIGDVCRVFSNKVVFLENSPSKNVIRRQMSLLGEMENLESNETNDILRVPTPLPGYPPPANIPIVFGSINFAECLSSVRRRSISTQNERVNNNLPQPAQQASNEIRQPQIQTMTRRSSFTNDQRRRSINMERNRREEQSVVSNSRPNSFMRSVSLPTEQNYNLYGARPKQSKK